MNSDRWFDFLIIIFVLLFLFIFFFFVADKMNEHWIGMFIVELFHGFVLLVILFHFFFLLCTHMLDKMFDYWERIWNLSRQNWIAWGEYSCLEDITAGHFNILYIYFHFQCIQIFIFYLTLYKLHSANTSVYICLKWEIYITMEKWLK